MSLICSKCLKEFDCLYTIPYELQSIIPYIRLCSKCDTEERIEKIQRIELLYKEQPKQEKIVQPKLEVKNLCKHEKLTIIGFESLGQTLEEAHYQCPECGDTIYILDKIGWLPC